jgi:hypothetical protein
MNTKRPQKAALLGSFLELFVELAGRAGDINSARDASFAVFDALHNAGGLAALRTIRALGRVHNFLAICCLGNLGHGEKLSFLSLETRLELSEWQRQSSSPAML